MKKSIERILIFVSLVLCVFLCAVSLAACNTDSRNTNSGLAENGDPHTHSYDDWVVTKRATCTEDGERERYCSCGQKQIGIIGALGHDYVLIESQPATCMQDGWEEYRTCSRCDYVSEITKIPAIGHDITHIEAKLPTCTQSGYEAYEMCSRCNYSTYTEISALGHDFGKWTVSVEATCTENGEEMRVCSRDENHFETREIYKINHKSGEWINGALPTCETDGYDYKECAECHTVTETRLISALGHDFGEWTLYAQPSCSKKGEEIRYCSRDKSHYEVRETAYTAHTESDWILTKQPTCEYEGLKIIECTVCHTTLKSMTVTANGHSDGDWREITPPTCENEGVKIKECSVCGKAIETSPVPALGHDYGDWKQTTAPTCTQDGVDTRICSHNSEHTQTRAIETLGHAYKWGYDGENHYYVCERCEDISLSSPHEWSGNTCTICGYSKKATNELNFSSNNGTSYTVSGIGSVTDENVVIPETYNGKPVTSIATYAFRNCNFIKTITVPESITSIGAGAFYGCNNLTEITLPFIGLNSAGIDYTHFGIIFGAATADENAEYVPESLQTVIINGNISSVPEHSFKGCANLLSVRLPSSVKRIGEYSFYCCASMTTITIPESVNYIGKCAFYRSGVSEVIFENTEGWMLVDDAQVSFSLPSSALSSAAEYLNSDDFIEYIWERI